MKIRYNVNADFEINKKKIDTGNILNDLLFFEIIDRLEKVSSKNGEVDDMTLEFLKIDRDSLESVNKNPTLVTNLKNKLDYLIQLHQKD